jgi:hypothetical protein
MPQAGLAPEARASAHLQSDLLLSPRIQANPPLNQQDVHHAIGLGENYLRNPAGGDYR